jgi:hypothetical protein
MKNKVQKLQRTSRNPPLSPFFKGGNLILLPLLKGGWEGFKWVNSYNKLSLSSLISLVKAKFETEGGAMEHEVFLPPLTFSGIMPAKGKGS